MPAIVIPAPISSNHAAPVTAGGTGATTAAAARTNLDVYSKSEVTSAISQSTAKTRLHAGATTPNSGATYALSESISNYEYVMIKCLTNAEIQSQIFATDMLLDMGRSPLFLAMANSSSGLVSDFGYKAYCIVHFASDGKSFTVTGAWTNANFIIKPHEIYGIKPV